MTASIILLARRDGWHPKMLLGRYVDNEWNAQNRRRTPFQPMVGYTRLVEPETWYKFVRQTEVS
jgi:hypothetical protein